MFFGVLEPRLGVPQFIALLSAFYKKKKLTTTVTTDNTVICTMTLYTEL